MHHALDDCRVPARNLPGARPDHGQDSVSSGPYLASLLERRTGDQASLRKPRSKMSAPSATARGYHRFLPIIGPPGNYPGETRDMESSNNTEDDKLKSEE